MRKALPEQPRRIALRRQLTVDHDLARTQETTAEALRKVQHRKINSPSLDEKAVTTIKIASKAVDYSKVEVGMLVNHAIQFTSGTASGTTTMPVDGTAPVVTEGTQFMSLSYTPKKVGNRVVVRGKMNLTFNNVQPVGSALFNGSTNIGSFWCKHSNNTIPLVMDIVGTFIVASLLPQTITARAGTSGAGTVYFNSDGGAARYNDSYLEITEYAQ